MPEVTRKSFLERAGAGLVGLAAFGELSVPRAAAQGPCLNNGYNNCKTVHHSVICASGTTSSCRVGYGFPSNVRSVVTRYSPNESYELTCVACCAAGAGRCQPEFFQARVAVRNGGSCGCTWVI
jgi:hypothetical protein